MIDMADLREDQRPDFCLTIHFDRGTPSPARLFRFASEYIEAFQSVDELLAQSIDSQIKPVLLLESIEEGSIKAWFKHFLEAIDDDALKNIDWRPAVGIFLVKAKHRLLERIGDAKKIDSREQLEQVANDVNKLAQETDVLRMPVYKPVTAKDIAYSAKQLGDAASLLQEHEHVTMESDYGDVEMRPGLVVTQEDIDEILASEVLENTTLRILMVRRPDFLGDASWEFRHEKRRLIARIEDDEWLGEFRSGQADIRPGDALKVEVFERTIYDRNGEVLDETRTIRKVIGIIREKQMPLS